MTESFEEFEPIDPEAAAFSLAKRIDALVEFLPRFEAEGASAGGWTPTQERDGCFTMPSFNFSPELAAFEQALYRYGWVVKFDWPDWQEKAARFVDSPESLRTADLEPGLFTSFMSVAAILACFAA